MAGRIAEGGWLASIHDGHAAWAAVLARVPRARMTEPSLPGGRTAEEVLAHIAWRQREAIGLARWRDLTAGSALRRLSDDERNAAVVARSRGRPLDEVLEESERVLGEYVAAVERLPEEALNDPRHVAGMPSGWRPWRTLHDREHDVHHTADVRAWVDGRRGAS